MQMMMYETTEDDLCVHYLPVRLPAGIRRQKTELDVTLYYPRAGCVS